MNHWLRGAASMLAVGTVVASLSLGGCSRVQVSKGKGIYHDVKKGETLWRICYAYRVNMATVCRVNGITDPERIRAGQRIFIPDAAAPLKIEPADRGAETTADVLGRADTLIPQRTPGAKTGQGPAWRGAARRGAGLRFVWPVKGLVTSWFGMRDGRRHDGIDIAVPQGTPIVAAESGIVIYSGDRIRGYGRLIILRHGDGFSSVYAHNWANRVSVDQIVARGQIIGFTGKSGRAQGEHLHFEIRDGVEALDPMGYLP